MTFPSDDQYDDTTGEWFRPFRFGWMARAKWDDERSAWLIFAIDHSGIRFGSEIPEHLTPEEALDRAELLAP